MATRFFTSDWHLNHSDMLKKYSKRQFESVDRMNDVIIQNANQRAKDRSDIIIHVGDFYCYNSDRGSVAAKINPSEYIKRINATFVNIKGNHDKNNKVVSIADKLITNIGPFNICHVTHHPSVDPLSRIKYLKNAICICGHVHNKWKYLYDPQRNILNINVGIDAWKYQILPESEIVDLIEDLGRKDTRIQRLINIYRRSK